MSSEDGSSRGADEAVTWLEAASSSVIVRVAQPEVAETGQRRVRVGEEEEKIIRELARIDPYDTKATEVLVSLQQRAAALISQRGTLVEHNEKLVDEADEMSSTEDTSLRKRKKVLNGSSRPRQRKKLAIPGPTKKVGAIHRQDWRCEWCKCFSTETTGKNPGPNGAATLCSACGSRYRSGHKSPLLPNENGKYACDACGKELDSIAALGGHRRFCDGGSWRCDWCKCTASECSGKNPGPNGRATLCGACGSRFRAGQTGPPKKKDGKYECDACGKLLDSLNALGGHRRFCDGGNWRCAWCKCTANECSGKNPGPDGPRTLCGTCGSRYRNGATGPPKRVDGKFICELCGKLLDSMIALGGHKRFCGAGLGWRCDWCTMPSSDRKAGPEGESTLCAGCHHDWKVEDCDAPPLIATGLAPGIICEYCGARFPDMTALITHRNEQCDKALHLKLYADGAEWLGTSRTALLGPVAKNIHLPKTAVGGLGKVGEDTSKYKAENDVAWPTAIKRLRSITNGIQGGERALDFWDVARHIARRFEGGPLQGLEPEDFLRQHGQWWLKLTPGMIAIQDGWDWPAYERGLTSINAVSPAFHGLNAIITRALIRHRGETMVDAETRDNSNQKSGEKPNKRRRIFMPWQNVSAHTWLTMLASAFPSDPLSEIVRTAQIRVREARAAEAQPSDQKVPSATELTSTLTPAERIELITRFGNILMNHVIMHQFVDSSTSTLTKIAALKREAWQGRQRATRYTEMCLRRNEPLIATVSFIKTDKRKPEKITLQKRVRLRLGPSPPLAHPSSTDDIDANFDDDTVKEDKVKAAQAERLEAQLAAHKLELDRQFAGLRCLAPSYRRRPLGTDRRGRTYFVLGDVWEGLFVRCPCLKAKTKKKAPSPQREIWGDPPCHANENQIRSEQPAATWYMLEPSQAAALRASLCLKQEAQLAAALDEVLPGLIATEGINNPTSILTGGAPAHEKEEEVCAVCGESTVDRGGKNVLGAVLLCDHCDAEVHFACSGLAKMPKEDEPFQCPACATGTFFLDYDDDPSRALVDGAASTTVAVVASPPPTSSPS